MNALAGVYTTYFYKSDSLFSKTLDSVANLALNFFKKFYFLSSYGLKTLLGVSSKIVIHGTSLLWDWKWQAIYLRCEVWLNEINRYYERIRLTSESTKLKRELNLKNEKIKFLEQELASAQKEVSDIRKELVIGYKFQIDIAAENTKLQKQIDDDKLITFRLEYQREILNKEEELVSLLKFMKTCYEELEAKSTSPLLSSHQYLVDTIIPGWKKHLESLSEILEGLIKDCREDLPYKKLMIQIVELAKRPLLFTEEISKICLYLSSKTTNALTASTLDAIDPSQLDPTLEQAMEELQTLLTKKILEES